MGEDSVPKDHVWSEVIAYDPWVTIGVVDCWCGQTHAPRGLWRLFWDDVVEWVRV